ncbi:DUF1329 domain-containing protein [Sinimarinibacterium sp. CAU 1509]|uniref:DUF1329 domain-containing protein n=1 Tax=Sinimarinibacterium sp. CAU 1509 TaxID=2562283 RepID=UPI0010AD4997|nr:DUF1329 domain-containing protein [Sinimarinibacterium sp. CAU 1509]TJY60803.1 DUF1329 domain-containing protein [Sinimarinibacterium sp. CAU 1509]
MNNLTQNIIVGSKSHVARSLTLALLMLASANANARVTDAEAARLGKELTPIGAERAGNADGTIPEWTGGLPQRKTPRGDNPHATDKPLYAITAANLAQHEAHLSEGYKALFKTFPDYRMPVYPSRRSASYPQWFYEATQRNATAVSLTGDGFGFCCAAKGYPFPIPKSGTEVMWNHIMRYNTKGYRGFLDSAATAADGAYVVERDYVELSYAYNNIKSTVDSLRGMNLYAFTKTVSPPNKAGEAHLLHVPIDRIKDQTGVWVYSNSIGRARRIGEVGYDNPLFDGLMTHDQLDMFNGPLDRYTIKLVGKKDMIIPYNSYKLYDPTIKYKDIVTKGHINQDLARYELHRVWIIEAEVRPGFAHRYKRRTFYLDEDSWIVHVQDIYDERDQFWRTAESHSIAFANVPVVVNGVQVHYDLQSRRYVIINMTNEERKLIEYDWEADPGYFTPSGLKRFATTSQK